MTVTKIATVTFRIKPEIKAALCEAAEREQRSLANMLEVMIRDYHLHQKSSSKISLKAANGSPNH
ncbi:hypothetical protein [Chromatium okenii]|uniref:hypothetical protein n=1 Tax=Chromatium okenii TaxID=61644 RepID=UPI0026EB844D|nr:hypothetical protein [Chromatium okenii]MBV5311582.1 hypothetical protein [Chromatium okenii]